MKYLYRSEYKWIVSDQQFHYKNFAETMKIFGIIGLLALQLLVCTFFPPVLEEFKEDYFPYKLVGCTWRPSCWSKSTSWWCNYIYYHCTPIRTRGLGSVRQLKRRKQKRNYLSNKKYEINGLKKMKFYKFLASNATWKTWFSFLC